MSYRVDVSVICAGLVSRADRNCEGSDGSPVYGSVEIPRIAEGRQIAAFGSGDKTNRKQDRLINRRYQPCLAVGLPKPRDRITVVRKTCTRSLCSGRQGRFCTTT